MTVYNEKTKRRVVPRWRNSVVAAAGKDFQPVRSSTDAIRFNNNQLVSISDEFEQVQDLGRAAELFAAAIRAGDADKLREAAEFIAANSESAPALLAEAALSVLAGKQQSLLTSKTIDDMAEVSRLRRLLRQRPRSANLWIDLARHQVALGETDKARRSVGVGLALAPDHRWVLRCASRFLLHAGDADEAHRLLSRHPRTRHDPWLISAELASAQIASRPPRFLSQGKDLLRMRDISPASVSELAAAVATIELESGSSKSARRLLKLALEAPTENALAQVEWAEREARAGLELNQILRRTPDAFEASCWVQYNQGSIEEALASAREWLRDESYATRPVAMVCYLAAFLDDYPTIIETARAALALHPDEVLHKNNLIYALVCKGDLFEQEEELNRYVDFLRVVINENDSRAAHSLANLGLLLYRASRYDEGKHVYEMASETARKHGNQLQAALAATMHAREAIVSGQPWAKEILDKADTLAKRVVSPGIAFYLRKLDTLIKRPDLAQEILSPQTAARFRISQIRENVLDELRLERTSNGPVLWVPRHLLKK